MLKINRNQVKKYALPVAAILLGFIGLTALYGGCALMNDPSGEILHLSAGMMRNSPFSDYFIPGLILFFVLGCGSLFLLAMTVVRKEISENFFILAGITVSGWIIVQIIIMPDVNWMHLIYFVAGLSLVLLGLKLDTRDIG